MAHRTFIVEDDPASAAHFSAVVSAMPELSLIGQVDTIAAARAQLDDELPDLLLTDLGLPDGNGIELITSLRKRSAQAEIVVISVFGDERNVVRSVEAGACGYLLKGGDAASLQRSIRELLAGGSPVSPAIARHLLRRFHKAAPACSPLSDREQEVLKHAAKGFTFPEVAELLGVTTHTVTTHMRRIYRKLEVSSKSEAVYEAVHLGLLSLEE